MYKSGKGGGLPDQMLVFSVELLTILWALCWIENDRSVPRAICSDSLAVLEELRDGKSKAKLEVAWYLKSEQHYSEYRTGGCSIGFKWVPGHVGIEGNDVTDKIAKHATLRENFDVQCWCTWCTGSEIDHQKLGIKNMAAVMSEDPEKTKKKKLLAEFLHSIGLYHRI